MARKPLRATPTMGIAIPLDTALRNGDDNFIELYAAGPGGEGAVASVNGETGVVVLDKSDIGLGNADNTADSAKPVSTAQQTALDLKSNLASPTFTGVPAAPTASNGTNTTQLATTQFVTTAVAAGGSGAVASVNGQTGVVVLTASDVGAAQTSDIAAAVAALVDSSPGTLDTLNELAAALGDDPDFATTIAASIAAKAPLASPALTGIPTAPTAAEGTNTTQLATTAFVLAEVAGVGGGVVVSPLSTNSTISVSNTVALVDATSGNLTISLAAAAGLQNITVKKVDGSANTVTVDADASETIDGGATAVLTSQYESLTLVTAGSNWSII